MSSHRLRETPKESLMHGSESHKTPSSTSTLVEVLPTRVPTSPRETGSTVFQAEARVYSPAPNKDGAIRDHEASF